MKKKCALITGITGQDGSYLAELLQAKGYDVHGVVRPTSTLHLERIDHLELATHRIDLLDSFNLPRLIHDLQPDEIYHLGAQTDVKLSYESPELTMMSTAIPTVRLLESIRHYSPATRFFQASSSEVFGGGEDCPQTPQTETTPFAPRSPYGCAKVYAHWIAANYRQAYGIHASTGIMFNHESPRRSETFVTRKITRAVAEIAAGIRKKLVLGNLEGRRDWGFAGDYVEAMWLMLQQKEADDYVIATGKQHSVREFVELAFSTVGLDWQKFVECDRGLYRPSDSDRLVGDASKARRVLGWKPRVEFAELVDQMVRADIEKLSQKDSEGRAAGKTSRIKPLRRAA